MDAGEWDERYRSADRLWSVTPNLYVADRLAGTASGRGLDLASGEGRNAIWLAGLGWSMIAVDFSEVATARGAGEDSGVEFIVADVTEWDTDERFDLVLIAYLHVMPGDFEKVVRRSPDWLAPDGELFMIGHDVSNIEHGHGGPQVPEILWDVDEIRDWLEGMTIVEAQVVRRPVDTVDGREFARDALVRARPAVAV